MNKKILLYDDDEDILVLCKTILERQNYGVTLDECCDVEKDVLSITPNLILMDLWIPEIGGEQAAKTIKENTTISDTPLLLFSANADIDSIAEKVGADDFISKPFSLKEFLDKIAGHLNQDVQSKKEV